MKKNLLVLLLCTFGVAAQSFAQVYSQPQQVQILNETTSEYIPVFQYWKEHNIFQHLDASISLGTTGVGIDVSSHIGESFQLRAGVSIMPKFDYHMNFGVQVGETKDESKFNSLAEMMESFTGYKVNNSVDMVGEPTWSNAHVLLDVFPFKNKHWHFTAGFFVGGSRVAKAYNTTEDMPSLMAVGIYNKLYENAINYEPMIEFGNYKFPDGDLNVQDQLYKIFNSYGRMGVHVGDFAHDIYDAEGNLIHEKGKPYMIEPDNDAMIKVDVNANSFRPYVGFGYGGRLIKNSDTYKISFDCGAMFWGGSPRVLTHEGIDLTKDVENIGGKVGTYVDMIKVFKVFPVINLRITRTIF